MAPLLRDSGRECLGPLVSRTFRILIQTTLHETFDLHQIYLVQIWCKKKKCKLRCNKGEDGKYRICPQIYNPM